MSANPKQQKELSLEKLNTLRDKIRQAYSIEKGGDELKTPKYKNSSYYEELKNDIRFKTKKSISEGTLLKFFNDDVNRTYQLNTIDAIEEYIEKVLLINKSFMENETKKKNAEELKKFAKRIYIELSTRKAGIHIDEEKDVIEDIYNSWYKLFCIIRDELKTLPIDCLKYQEKPDSVVFISFKILDEILRPHLTEYQAKYRSWLENAKKDLKNKKITPQELQKKYPDYDILIKSIKQVNEMLIDSAEKFYELLNQK